MTRQQHLFRLALTASLLAVAPALAAADESTDISRVVYTAKLADASIFLAQPASLPITVRLGRLTSATEAEQLDRLLAERGPAALHDALAEQILGHLEIDGRIGDPIRFARRFHDQDGEHLVLIAQRPPATGASAWPEQRFPYFVVTLDLTPDGLGSGDLVAAARFRRSADGRVALDSPGFLSSRLLAVRELGS